jgi:SAM-dependent methyltransferase
VATPGNVEMGGVMESGKYIVAQGDQTEEDERLGLLAEFFDPFTHEYLTEAGIAPGWRCLEVGAGSGTVAAWMAEQVGDAGLVTAVDIDTSRLGHLADAGADVREHDVLSAPVETGAFDLVHARAVLLHLPDPAQALANMAAALAPGGWLVIGDADFGSWGSATPEHPHAALFDAANKAIYAALDERGVMSPFLAGRHVGLFQELDLDDIRASGRYEVIHGGSPGARFWQITATTTLPLFVDAGVIDEKTAETLIAIHDDPTFAYVPATSTVTMARRPA